MLDRGGALALTTLVVYAWLAPAHIVDGDNAELATLGSLGGAAHPSGYPLYLMWLRAMQWLPGASPAHTAAIATAVLGALGVWVLFAACRAWGARPLGATVAVGVIAMSPPILRIATEAEVFALNNLIVATVLWLAAQRGPLTGALRIAALAGVAGLGLANHMTCVLVAPVGLVGVVRAIRQSRGPAITGVGLALGALCLGLLPYVYLLVTPETALSWGKVDSLDGLVAHVLRRDYGGATAFLPTGESVTALDQLVALARTLGRAWLVGGAIGGLAMLALGIVRRGSDEECRLGWAALAVSWLLAGPLLALRYNIAPVELGLYVLERFHVLPVLLLAIPVAVGLTRLERRLGERRWLPLAAVLPVLVAASLSVPRLARIHVPAVEQYARNVLGAMPPGAVVVIGSDAEYLGLNYVQWAIGERTDVIVIAPPLTVLPWYRARIAARGVPLDAAADLGAMLGELTRAGRPVFVEQARIDLIGASPWYPYATLLRMLPPGASLPAPSEVFDENEAAFARFRLTYPRPGTGDEFATAIHRRYASTWNALARHLTTSGNPSLAARALAFAQELGPR